MTAEMVAGQTRPGPVPTVSCVMIFLDAARFIDESIRSVIAQTHRDWELILVDDGSTDASSAIAQHWARSDPRIRYVDHEGHANLGMSTSRNRGIAEARGHLVAFLDSDDVWMPSALSHRLRVLDAHPTAEAMVGGTWRWYSWTLDAADERLDNKMALPPALPRLQVVEPVDGVRRRVRVAGCLVRPGDVQHHHPARPAPRPGRDDRRVRGDVRGPGAVHQGAARAARGVRRAGLVVVPPARRLRVCRSHPCRPVAAGGELCGARPVPRVARRVRPVAGGGDAAVRRVLELNLARPRPPAPPSRHCPIRAGPPCPATPRRRLRRRSARWRHGCGGWPDCSSDACSCSSVVVATSPGSSTRWTNEHVSGWPRFVGDRCERAAPPLAHRRPMPAPAAHAVGRRQNSRRHGAGPPLRTGAVVRCRGPTRRPSPGMRGARSRGRSSPSSRSATTAFGAPSLPVLRSATSPLSSWIATTVVRLWRWRSPSRPPPSRRRGRPRACDRAIDVVTPPRVVE